jgi:hypothetical protein
MALPLTWQIVNISGWVAWQVTNIFENIGVVQEGMMTIAKPIGLADAPQAPDLKVTRGEIVFEDLRFGYGREIVTRDGESRYAVLDGFTLNMKPGEKIGLVGRSGAGKSTAVNLLLRFFDVEEGRILIDGQDIASVTQESLRAQISVVTQDTSLLHRSIRENIRYGRPAATDAEVEQAAALAHAEEFIATLEDWKGRRGYDAQVGERVLLTIVPNGFAVHMLHLFGMIPGRCLFGANDLLSKQMLSVLTRDASLLPPLPRAKKHQDDSAMHAFLDAAADDLKAAADNKPIPGKVQALDLENPKERPLSLFTRLALTARDTDDLVRLLERTRNTV